MVRRIWARLTRRDVERLEITGTALRAGMPVPDDHGDDAMRRLIEQMKAIEGSGERAAGE